MIKARFSVLDSRRIFRRHGVVAKFVGGIEKYIDLNKSHLCALHRTQYF
jgi:hypothetical protein